MINWKLLALIPVIAVTGCAEHVNERSGSNVDVFPVTYSLALTKPSPFLQQFIDSHFNVILEHGVTIETFSSVGKRWAMSVRKDLVKRGVEPKSIKILPGISKDDDRFDLSISTTNYTTQVQQCGYYGIGDVEDTASGCFVENSRWISMVNPQKMLIKTSPESTKE
ncbi:hypothetical protein M9194_05090 [Vibrio sp. S4M6]|uniref:hypothetical protein n=1 Tax=Vibrio sinus TaxID=2946865 RepID=UPI00202A293B|nr:hypothetical protein [Vibrio sinus]MCL9780814.1 hypothetical protein [Vibrio sinus]